MASSAFIIAYRCVENRYSASVDTLLYNWLFNMSNQTLKIEYDTAYSLAGGIVGDSGYQTALNWLHSQVVTITVPDGTQVEVIQTPNTILSSIITDWQNELQNPLPCALVRGW